MKCHLMQRPKRRASTEDKKKVQQKAATQIPAGSFLSKRNTGQRKLCQ